MDFCVGGWANFFFNCSKSKTCIKLMYRSLALSIFIHSDHNYLSPGPFQSAHWNFRPTELYCLSLSLLTPGTSTVSSALILTALATSSEWNPVACALPLSRLFHSTSYPHGKILTQNLFKVQLDAIVCNTPCFVYPFACFRMVGGFLPWSSVNDAIFNLELFGLSFIMLSS